MKCQVAKGNNQTRHSVVKGRKHWKDFPSGTIQSDAVPRVHDSWFWHIVAVGICPNIGKPLGTNFNPADTAQLTEIVSDLHYEVVVPLLYNVLCL